MIFDIIECTALTPTFERETFSGGCNNSAIARNRQRLLSSRVVVLGDRIYCARGMASILAETVLMRVPARTNVLGWSA